MIDNNIICHNNIYDYAKEYEDRGFKLLKIVHRGKSPAGSWIYGTEAHANAEFYKSNTNYGIGVIGGSASGIYIIDVDDRSGAEEYFSQYGIDINNYRTKTACFHRGNPNKFKLVFDNPNREDLDYVDLIHTELRADTKHQDVFPPSIHQEGQAYTWENPLKNIIELPAEIRAIWNLESKKKNDVVKSISNPNTETKTTPEGANVFDCYNDLVGAESALISHGGYIRVGNRWKPANSQNTPGITIYDNLVIASKHVTSDPMAQHLNSNIEGTIAYNPFMLMAYEEQNGDMTAATAYAYEYCESRGYVFNEPDSSVDISELIKNAPKEDIPEFLGENKVPSGILRIPGKAQGLVDAYNKSAYIHQPQFAVQAALAIVATIAARRFRVTRPENLSNFFFEIVGDSSSGKNHTKKFIKTVLSMVDVYIGPSGSESHFSAAKYITGGEYKSGAGVFNACLKKPVHINIIDEAGMKQDSQNKSEHGSGIKGALLNQWSSAITAIYKGTYSGGDITKEDLAKSSDSIEAVENPCIIIFGISTPNTYYASLASADIYSGYLGRHLIVESQFDGREFNIEAPAVSDCIDPQTINWLKGLFTAYNYAPNTESFNPILFMTMVDNPLMSPAMVSMQVSHEALMMFKKLHADFIDKYGKDNPLSMKGMEMTVRISMMVALSCETTSINIKHAMWAKEYVSYYIHQMVVTSNMKIAGSKYESDWKEIYEIIYKGKEEGANARDFGRKKSCAWGGATTKQQGDMLHTIINAKEIVFVRIENGKPGTKRHAWVAPEFLDSEIHMVAEYDWNKHKVLIRDK